MASRRKRDDARLIAAGKPPAKTTPPIGESTAISGRPSKLNEGTIETIANAFRLGLPISTAAGFIQVFPTTVTDWMARGKEDREAGRQSVYSRLSEAIEKAIADRCAESLMRIRKAAQGGDVVEKVETTVTAPDGTITRTLKEKKSAPSWTADAWFLERTRPQEFGRLIRTEITGANGGPLESKTWLDVMRIAQGKEGKTVKEATIVDAEIVEGDGSN